MVSSRAAIFCRLAKPVAWPLQCVKALTAVGIQVVSSWAVVECRMAVRRPVQCVKAVSAVGLQVVSSWAVLE